MGRYDWSAVSDAVIKSETDTDVTVRVTCSFKNKDWTYSLRCSGYVQFGDMAESTLYENSVLDTTEAGLNGLTVVGSQDYTVPKGEGNKKIRYRSRIMSDCGYADGNKVSDTHEIEIPSLKSYVVSYDANGGSGAPQSQKKWHGKGIYIRYEIPSKEHAVFSGWATSIEDAENGIVAYTRDSVYRENSNATLYAVWEPDEHTVSFMNGYTDIPVSSDNIKHGSSASAPTVVRDGYTFAGWDKAFDNVCEDMVVTALWEPKKYRLTVGGMLNKVRSENIDGYGTFDMYIDGVLYAERVSGFDEPVDYGSVYAIDNIVTPDKYEFDGCIEGSLSGAIGLENNVVMSFSTKRYDITYSALDCDSSTREQYKLWGETVTVPSETPVLAAHTFAGWSSEVDGEVVYTPGDEYTKNEDAQLYASFDEPCDISIRVPDSMQIEDIFVNVPSADSAYDICLNIG